VFQPLVVVGVGGSPAGWQALSWAETQVSRAGGHLRMCYACAKDSALAVPGAASRLSVVELAEPALARAIAAARSHLGGDRVSVVVRAVPPEELLVDAANSADMVVLGAPVHTGLREWGSTAHYVVSHAASPVVVVRPFARADQTDPHPPLSGHVVVGVDGSSAARAALEFGFRYASAHRRPLAAVAVTAHADGDMWYDDAFGETHLAPEPVVLEQLAVEVEPWHHKFPDVAVKRAVFAGRAMPGLTRAAARAALLVIGNRGFGPARSVLMGSMNHLLVDRAPCPVALVRGDDGRVELR
jgi:nucleotide-binding universal stress UspA family protein